MTAQPERSYLMQRWLVGRLLHPVSMSVAATLLVVAMTLAASGWDALALARLGTYYSRGDPAGTRGYDGQFVVYIARDPRPSAVAAHLDAPAYRYQRILLPLLGRALALGNDAWIPWALLFIGVASHAGGTWALASLLRAQGGRIRYALPYGLFAGFLLAVRLDLPEPLAVGLALAGLLARHYRRSALSWMLFGLALFAKETAVLFVLAALASDLLEKRWRDALGLFLAGILPYILFQFWLLRVFGQFGIGSGGDMATPFEIFPLRGLLRIAEFSPVYFIGMLVVFGPAVVLPALWGVWAGARRLLDGDAHVTGLALLANSAVILFLPFSTFREPGGLLRFACGLVPAVLLAASHYHQRRVLNYSFLWIVLLIFLLKT